MHRGRTLEVCGKSPQIKGAYETGDLDFILTDYFVKNLLAAMKEIGFERRGRHYVHPEASSMLIFFPACDTGPPAFPYGPPWPCSENKLCPDFFSGVNHPEGIHLKSLKLCSFLKYSRLFSLGF